MNLGIEQLRLDDEIDAFDEFLDPPDESWTDLVAARGTCLLGPVFIDKHASRNEEIDGETVDLFDQIIHGSKREEGPRLAMHGHDWRSQGFSSPVLVPSISSPDITKKSKDRPDRDEHEGNNTQVLSRAVKSSTPAIGAYKPSSKTSRRAEDLRGEVLMRMQILLKDSNIIDVAVHEYDDPEVICDEIIHGYGDRVPDGIEAWREKVINVWEAKKKVKELDRLK